MNTSDIIIIEPQGSPGVPLSERVAEFTGYATVSAVDADHCLRLITESHPRLIVVKHRPPECDALESVRKIRETHPSLRVVVCSGGQDAEFVRDAFLAGASDVLGEDVLCDGQTFREVIDGSAYPLLNSPLWYGFDNLADILDTMADAVSIQDRSLRVLYQNRAHVGLVGEHTGEYCYQAYAEGDEPCRDCPVLGCFEDGTPHSLLKKGGKGLVVDITASPLKDPEGNVWAGIEVVRDVTHKQRLEDALRNTAEGVSAETGEKFFDSLTEYLVKTLGVNTSFIGVLDENDPELSRTISVYQNGKHLNNFWYRMSGTPCGEVAARGTCVFRESLLENFPDIDMLKNIGAESYVGTPLISSSGGLLGVLSVVDTKSDFDFELAESLLKVFAARAAAELDRLQAENALKESGRRLREMLENVKLAAVMLDTNSGVFFVNDFLLEVTGYARDEVLGKNWFELFVPKEIAPELELKFLKMIAAEDVAPHQENDILTRDGGMRTISWSNTLLRDDSGAVMGVCSIGEDVTEKKRAEAERSELFHMMTHDIKGPLSIVNGYSELLLGDDPETSVKDYAAEIGKASRRIFSLIEDMLALAAIESGADMAVSEPVYLTSIVKQAVDDIMLRAGEMGLSVQTDFMADDSTLVRGDRGQLRRAVDNLLLNAVNYNRYEGAVTVRTGLSEDGKRIFLEVSDTGSGIPGLDLPHIFEKYYRSKVTGKKHGTGLGLAIAKRVVESSGGTVEAWNNKSEGATFRVELPVMNPR